MIFFNQLKKGRLLGHPIHSMLVHFPSALFPITLVFDVIGIILSNTSFATAAVYTLVAGLMGAVVAAIFGMIDFYHLPSTHEAWGKAALHALLNIFWICLFTILLALRARQYPHFELATPAELMISIIGVVGIIFSNFLGGDLVFRHKIGIHKDP